MSKCKNVQNNSKLKRLCIFFNINISSTETPLNSRETNWSRGFCLLTTTCSDLHSQVFALFPSVCAKRLSERPPTPVQNYEQVIQRKRRRASPRVMKKNPDETERSPTRRRVPSSTSQCNRLQDLCSPFKTWKTWMVE